MKSRIHDNTYHLILYMRMYACISNKVQKFGTKCLRNYLNRKD